MAILPLSKGGVSILHFQIICSVSHPFPSSALKAQPNPAHIALSAFSLPSIRHQIAPGSTFTLITQNVDGLSIKADKQIQANEPPAADEQPRLIEIHGRLFDVLCTSGDCDHVEFNTSSPICEGLSGTEAHVAAGDLDPEIPIASLPRCAKCGSLARPGVVWFGEMPHKLDEIDEIAAKADLCLVVGTSSTARSLTCTSVTRIADCHSQVYPAAGYAGEVQDRGGKVAVFNLDRSKGDHDADYLFLGPCEETLPRALGLTN